MHLRAALFLAGLVGFVTSTALAQSESEPADPTSTIEGSAELTDDTFDHWRSLVKPSEEEQCWREIPWRESFYEGLKDAQIEGKPVVLWAMNGHPLGCV